MTFQRVRLVFFLSLALTVVLAACGDNASDDAESIPTEPPEPETAVTDDVEPTAEPSPSPSPTSTAEPTPSPTVTPEVTPSPEPSPSPMPTVADSSSPLTAEDLEAFLLTPDDVPDDWEQIPTSGNPTENPPCGVGEAPAPLRSAPFALVDFMGGYEDSILGQALIWLENEEDAISAMAWYDDAFSCGEFDEGAGHIWQFVELDSPALGDQSFLYQLNLDSDGDQFTMLYGFVRQGQFLSLVAGLDAEAVDVDLLTSLIQIAVDKLPE